jgi:putative flippase GtrA
MKRIESERAEHERKASAGREANANAATADAVREEDRLAMPMMARLHERFAHLIPELAKFGVVGLTGSIIDLGGAAYLHGAMGIGPLSAKAISITAATIVTYLGSRFWTFRHRVNQALLREGTLFVALNVIGLAIAEAVIAFTNYGLGFKSALAYNAASVAGTGLGTIFRYFSYKKWVFLAGAPGTVVAAEEAAVSGIVDVTKANGSGPVRAGARGRHERPSRDRGYGPPWEELEPPANLGYGPAWEHLDPADSDVSRR